MAAALRLEFGEFLNLAVSMTQICGHFITIEQTQTQSVKQRISLIHTTAREFLLNDTGEDGSGSGWIDEKLAHETIAKTCLAYLCDEQWKSRFASIPVTTGNDLVRTSGEFPILRYAVNHWAKHVSKSPVHSLELLEALEIFMLNHCLSWMEALSLSGNMAQLVQSAKHLEKFVKRSTRQARPEQPGQSTPAMSDPSAGGSPVDNCLWEWWLPSDDLLEYPNVKAKDMSLSEDGSLLVSVGYTGTVSIWALPQLHLVYRLTCSLGGDPSVGIVFSPDSQRFYDIRGSVCNVWGPDALVRSDEDPDNDDATSTSGSYVVTEPVVTATQSAENAAITALAVGPEDKFFARALHSHSLHSSVNLLSWPPSGKYMISGDGLGHIVCKRLQIKDVKPPTPERERTRSEPRGFTGRWAVFPVFDCRLKESARQALFSPDERLLLVSTDDAEHIWDLRAKQEVIPPLERKEGQTRAHWALHPHKP
ncbi:hypothetical protein PspLS_11252 [Pyricularia sp. CBS 133598]|nr:hypothetical protein PspLS_11252 [Pyricularia sp. CBS 133598]